MRDYTKIEAWELADDFAVEVYRISADFPEGEKYALTSQLRRAAYSIAANIADGVWRRTIKDFCSFPRYRIEICKRGGILCPSRSSFGLS